MVDIPLTTIGENLSDEMFAQLQSIYGYTDPNRVRAQLQEYLESGGNPADLISSEIMSPGTADEALTMFLNIMSERGEVAHGTHDAGRLREQSSEYFSSEAGRRKLLDQIGEFMESMAFRTNPEIWARVLQKVLEQFPPLKAPPKPPAIEGISFSFDLDITEVNKLLSGVSGKVLFSKKDAKEMAKIVYSRTVLQAVTDAVTDIINDQIAKVEEASNVNFGIASAYNKVLIDVVSNSEKIMENIVVNRRRELANIESFLTNVIVDRGDVHQLITHTMEVFDKLETDLTAIRSMAEGLANELLSFVHENRLSSFKANPDQIIGIYDILAIIQGIIPYIDNFISLIFERIGSITQRVRQFAQWRPRATEQSQRMRYYYTSAQGIRSGVISGQASGGLVFFTIAHMLKSMEYDIDQFLQLFQYGSRRTDLDAKIHIDYERLKGKGMISARSKSWYDMVAMARGKNAIDYVFSIADEMTTDLRGLGFDDELINELRSKIIDIVYNRTGLEEEIHSFLESRISQNIGL